MRSTHALLVCSLTLGLLGCDAFASGQPGPDPRRPADEPSVDEGFTHFSEPEVPEVEPRHRSGPIVQSAVAPVPINGGTLLATSDGARAIAADPDRDRVVIADLASRQVSGTVELSMGDEPGRLAQDAGGLVYVLLRRAGEVATIDPATASLLDRRAVCASPQGIAYDPERDALHVACRGGELVTLPAGEGQAERRVHVDLDLRDVLVLGERLFVTRFKSAELLELGESGQVLSRERPQAVQGPFGSLLPLPPNSEAPAKTFDSAVAWRTVAAPDGSLAMLHQRVQVDTIGIDEDDAMASHDGSCPECDLLDRLGGGGEGGAYGAGGLSCDSIVRSTMTGFGDGGTVHGPVFAGVTLAVDAAVSPDGNWLAVAVAGSSQESAMMNPLGFQVAALVLASSTVEEEPAEDAQCFAPLFGSSGAVLEGGQAVAVAFAPGGELLLQMREPNLIRVVSIGDLDGCLNCIASDEVIALGGESRRDTGHDLFHTDAGAGLACASCHPGGADDGHTWSFSGLGPRRTQLFNMGIADTLPLHWDGELPTFASLVDEVFVRRMGGPLLAPDEVAIMEDWIETLVPEPALRTAQDPAVERGRALFESADVGCTSCHSGPKLTNNMTVDVGTGVALQVPSLLGVVHHQPYMHTGCARTLHDRFDPSCGGDKHGNTAHLADDDIDDLVAYLESL